MRANAVRERRHRLPREAYVGQVAVAFTACVGRREPLFQDSGVVHQFASLLRDCAQRYASSVIIYCFMPDHVHVVLQGNEENADLWRAVVAFKQRTGFWLKRNSPGVAWQKDFFDRVIRGDSDLLRTLRYVAENPVRAGLAVVWNEYPFLGSDVYVLEDVFSAA
jgi:putative transposase